MGSHMAVCGKSLVHYSSSGGTKPWFREVSVLGSTYPSIIALLSSRRPETSCVDREGYEVQLSVLLELQVVVLPSSSTCSTATSLSGLRAISILRLYQSP